MSKSTFVYVTFIRTTPVKLWEALTDPQFIRQYWFGMTIESGWTKGSPWKMARPDGSLTDSGEIMEIEPQRRMVIQWRHERNEELKAEGDSLCTFELEPVPDAEPKAVKLRACEFFKNQTRRLSRSEFDLSERVRIDLFDVPKG